MIRMVEYALPELLERVQSGEVPADIRVQVLIEDAPKALTTPSKDPALALLEQWNRGDALLVPEARVENDRVYSEIEKNDIPRLRL